MVASNTSVDWRQLREFADVDLERSFVLSWRVDGDTLLVEVDLVLTEGHPFYEKPRPKEKVCIRAGMIEFPYCQSIRGVEEAGATAPADIVDRLGRGAISGFRRMDEGPFEISGRFGSVLIDAERPILRLRGP